MRRTVSMHVAFDHHVFCLQRHGGISRYFCELGARLAARPGVTVRVFARLHRNELLAECASSAQGLSVEGRFLSLSQSAYATLLALNWLARAAAPRESNVQVLHETFYQSAPAPGFRGPRVATVHDMIHEMFPEAFARSDTTALRKRRTLARADRVLCVSERTRLDLLERVAISPDRVSVVHHGCSVSPSPAPLATVRAHLNDPARPYLLFVGAREGYKNFARLAAAFASSPALRREFSLLCFGGGAFTASERESLRALGLRQDEVTQLGGDDALLAGLYANARALVVPSLYEGFGLPVIEAMSLRCPVIAADVGALPEVAADAALLFDPRSVDAMRDALSRVALDDEALRATLVLKGVARAGAFSWDRCADETLAVYRTLAP